MQKAYVFGKGNLYRAKKEYIKTKYEVAGFFDNFVAPGSGTEFEGVPVYHPSEVTKLPEYPILICALTFLPMWRQMKDSGVPDERLRFMLLKGRRISKLEDDLFAPDAALSAKEGKIVYSLGANAFSFSDEEGFRAALRGIYRMKFPIISAVASGGTEPLSRDFGTERGLPVDRYYIAAYLNRWREDIRGTVMEVAEPRYTRMFGGGRVRKEIIVHVRGDGGALRANFETGEGLREGMADCLICTQVLQYIYDVRTALRNIHRLLKPGGTALITAPGIKSLSLGDDAQWDEHWSFTEKSLRRMCTEACTDGSVEVCSYGNVKTAAAFLYGFCAEDLSESDFLYQDRQFPFLICARMKKR